MSELMTPMSFEHLLNWILKEHKQYGTVFGEHDLGAVVVTSTAFTTPVVNSNGITVGTANVNAKVVAVNTDKNFDFLILISSCIFFIYFV